MPAFDSEIAFQNHFGKKRTPARGNFHMGAKTDHAVERRTRFSDKNAEQILDAAVAHMQIQRGGFAGPSGAAGDAAFCEESGSNDGRVHMFEAHVAVEGIHKGVVTAAQRKTAARAGNFEIRNFDVAVGFNIFQDAREIILRGERAADSRKYSEVGVFKFVGAGDRGLPGIVGIPRAEMPMRFNFAWRQSIRERGIVAHGFFAADGVQGQRMYFVAQGFFAVLAADFEQCVIGHDFGDAGVGRIFLFRSGASGAARGNLNMQPFEHDARNISGMEEEIDVVGPHGELSNGDQRRRARRARRVNEGEVFRDASGMRKIGDTKFPEADLAVESFFERLGYAIAGEWEMPGENEQANSEKDEQGNSGDDEPSVPSKERIAVRRAALSVTRLTPRLTAVSLAAVSLTPARLTR